MDQRSNNFDFSSSLLPNQINMDMDGDDENDESFDASTGDKCEDGKYLRHEEIISSSRFRTIHKAYNNESGCEVAWCTYEIHKRTDQEKKKKLL
jgi:hypothetical protein